MLVGDHIYKETYSVWAINKGTIVNILQLLLHQILLTSLFARLQHPMVTKKWPKSMVRTPHAPFRGLSEHQIFFNLHIRPKWKSSKNAQWEVSCEKKPSVYVSDGEALYCGWQITSIAVVCVYRKFFSFLVGFWINVHCTLPLHECFTARTGP